jgi:cytochrome c553
LRASERAGQKRGGPRHGLCCLLAVELTVFGAAKKLYSEFDKSLNLPSHQAGFALIIPPIMKKLIALLALASVANLAAAADVVGNPKTADNKVAMCIGCHGIPGYKATFPEVYQVPMIGGQSAKYIESALRAYQKGERKNPSMRGIAGGLSDQDIADVAAYYAQQK